MDNCAGLFQKSIFDTHIHGMVFWPSTHVHAVNTVSSHWQSDHSYYESAEPLHLAGPGIVVQCCACKAVALLLLRRWKEQFCLIVEVKWVLIYS